MVMIGRCCSLKVSKSVSTGTDSIPALVLSMIDELLSEPPLSEPGDMSQIALYNAFIEINEETV